MHVYIVNVIVDLRFMIGLVKLSSAHKILTELSLSYTLYVLVDLSITYKKIAHFHNKYESAPNIFKCLLSNFMFVENPKWPQ